MFSPVKIHFKKGQSEIIFQVLHRNLPLLLVSVFRIWRLLVVWTLDIIVRNLAKNFLIVAIRRWLFIIIFPSALALGFVNYSVIMAFTYWFPICVFWDLNEILTILRKNMRRNLSKPSLNAMEKSKTFICYESIKLWNSALKTQRSIWSSRWKTQTWDGLWWSNSLYQCQ